MAKKILITDTYYPPAWRAMPIDISKGYEACLKTVLDHGFGTGDFYSHHLMGYGWDVRDTILNHVPLQRLWSAERGQNQESLQQIATDQVLYYKPDVLFCQDLSFFSSETLWGFKKRGIVLAGQCSCPFPYPENVKPFDVLFTSFPHYVEKFKALGVDGVFNPLGFEERILSRITLGVRDLPVVFIGGVGTPSHWTYGMKVLEAIAESFKGQVHFYGYGYDQLPAGNPVREAWYGNAWGMAMYQLLARAKIVINRHGEVSEGYTNNMRCYEATGCGALLMTETSKNLAQLFVPGLEVGAYESIPDLVQQVKDLLENDEVRQLVARNGQKRTLHDHTYHYRMGAVSQVLKEYVK